ncbi:MAG: hypothetical protein HY245_12645 [Rhizobiales bacterium]|nr:hypothetical protein [Hyphomicrobiales bacterium]MBI3674238.1 hypothetical protein [Hyphomicrobiales bacterium]
MSADEPTEAAPAAVEAGKPAKKVWPRKLSKKATDKAGIPALVGRGRRISIKTDASTAVELTGKKGAVHTITIEGPAAMGSTGSALRAGRWRLMAILSGVLLG